MTAAANELVDKTGTIIKAVFLNKDIAIDS